jgi:hypothetical protein
MSSKVGYEVLLDVADIQNLESLWNYFAGVGHFKHNVGGGSIQSWVGIANVAYGLGDE